jgi:hypothetical protein
MLHVLRIHSELLGVLKIHSTQQGVSYHGEIM